MRKKIMSIVLLTLLTTTILPPTILAGDEEHPEITDVRGDAFGYIDIESIWFFEKEENPGFLFISMKINQPSKFKPQQTFAVFWTYHDIRYSCGLCAGFSLSNWQDFNVIIYNGREEILKANGTYNYESRIITFEIPKALIGNPQPGDELTNTWSNAFRRLGFIGRIGFTRNILDIIILIIFGNDMWDYAPARGEYGLNYLIQY